MAKKTKITKEELRTYIPLREEFAIYVPKPDGDGESDSIEYFSTSILVPPELFGSPEYLYLAGSVNKPEGSPTGYPTRFFLLEEVCGISKEREYKTFSDEEIRLIIDYYKRYGNEDKKIDIIEVPVPRVYKTTRELSILMTRPRKKGKDLFSLLSDEIRQELAEKGGDKVLLSSLTSGLAFENPLQYKITKALGKTLYRQTQGYNKTKAYNGEGLPSELLIPKIGKIDKDFSYIVIDPFSFTKETLGRNDIGGNDVQRVMSELATMDGKFYWDDRDGLYKRSLSVEAIKPGTRGGDRGQMIIALRPIYREGLEKEFINSREDELELLSGVTSVLSLRLFEVLKEMISYRLPTWRKGRYFDLIETELLERIAVKKSYDNQTKRKLSDFESAVQDMKKIGILADREDNPKRIGKNLRFYVRKDWDLSPDIDFQEGEEK